MGSAWEQHIHLVVGREDPFTESEDLLLQPQRVAMATEVRVWDGKVVHGLLQYSAWRYQFLQFEQYFQHFRYL